MAKKQKKTIWIAWERHRRTIELNKTFSTKLFILESNLPRIFKHPILSLKTWGILHSERPEILFVQNPSVVLTLLAIFLRLVYKYKLMVDAHNAGLIPDHNFLKRFYWIYAFMQRKADFTIVTNRQLAKMVKKNCGNPYILPDKIPEVGPVKKIELQGKEAILYICTFGEDEPYLELLKAAEILDDSVYIYITGKYDKNNIVVRSAPSNVIFTGYLPEDEYWNMLHSVNLTIDLTYRENCLVCGAYESVAAETPMVLSNKVALRNLFSKGVIFSLNNANAIANAIKTALQNEDSLKKEIKELKNELSCTWEKKAANLLNFCELCG